MANEITERTVEVNGIEVFLREVAGEGTPTLFVHGNPTNSLDWVPFLERMEGPAIALDLPGYGRSARPDPATFDHTVTAYVNFFGTFFDELMPGSYKLVVHDWGGLALIASLRHPQRVDRLVVSNSVPIQPGYRWHWIARIWRRRWIGEAFSATATKPAAALLLRQARSGHKRMPKEFVDMVWEQNDAGNRRAVLALYRSGDPDFLAAQGARLGEITCPALVIWGRDDPFIGIKFGRDYAEVLPNAELVDLEGAGHWPWIDRPEVIDQVVEFVGT